MCVGSPRRHSTLYGVEPEDSRPLRLRRKDGGRLPGRDHMSHRPGGWSLCRHGTRRSASRGGIFCSHIGGTCSAQPASPRPSPFCSHHAHPVLHPHVPEVLHVRSKDPRSAALGRGGGAAQLPLLCCCDSNLHLKVSSGIEPGLRAVVTRSARHLSFTGCLLFSLSPPDLCWYFL